MFKGMGLFAAKLLQSFLLIILDGEPKTTQNPKLAAVVVLFSF